MRLIPAFLAVLSWLWAPPALAGEAAIVGAKAERLADGRYRFSVTLRHADTGWAHYADGWQVLGQDGAVLGSRELLHPHVNEQPFTRSLCCVRVPAGLGRVSIRAHDKRHGFAKKTRAVDLPGR
jgi:hypothetical protein